jgi:hypothetical protein
MQRQVPFAVGLYAPVKTLGFSVICSLKCTSKYLLLVLMEDSIPDSDCLVCHGFKKLNKDSANHCRTTFLNLALHFYLGDDKRSIRTPLEVHISPSLHLIRSLSHLVF